MPHAQSAERYLELDLLRSVAVICMIVYHAAYDLASFFRWDFDPLSGGWIILELFTANLFLMLVGVSFAVSWKRRNNRQWTATVRKYGRRSLLLFACAGLVSAATYLVDPQAFVRFGVLHLIATAVLILPLVAPLREGNILLAAVAFSLGGPVAHISVSSPLLLPIGLHDATFASVDYFPLLPWLAPIFLGVALGNVLYVRNMLRLHFRSGSRSLTSLATPGRYALPIYLIHQPALLLIFFVAQRIPH